MRRILIAAAGAVLATSTLAGPAHADPKPVDPPPAPQVLTDETTVTAKYYDDKGKLVDTETYDASTEGQDIVPPSGITPMDTGSGGTSSASGCTKVEVHNKTKTSLGFTAFIFHTSTSWCWNRSSQVVSSVNTGHRISDVDSQFQYKGILTEFTVKGFYDYSVNDGHPRSAYKYYEMAHFTNCVFKYGCVGDYYPANTIRSYYNGTWAWQTDDDAK